MSLQKVLLDASAYIAYLNKEPGYEVIQDCMHIACINTVTYSEIIAFYARNGISDKNVLSKICQYVHILDINQKICFDAGCLITQSTKYGLSLGDRICLSSAIHYNIPVYTADKIWQKLANLINVKVNLVR